MEISPMDNAGQIANPLRLLLAEMNISGADICLSGRGQIAQNAKPLYFQHIHKTGGMSVTVCMRIAIWADSRITEEDAAAPWLKKSTVAKFDTREVTAKSEYSRRLKYSFISSHHNMAAYERCHQEFVLATVFRHPFERIVSDYHYHIWRKMLDEPMGEKSFVKFFRNEKNICMSCQHLSSLSIASADLQTIYEDASETLHRFDTYGTTDDLEAFLQGIWDYYGFQNLMSTRWLSSLGKFKRRDFSKFEDEIRELNEYDFDLYERARANPRFLSPIPAEPAPLSEFTILAIDSGDDQGLYSENTGIIKTGAFLASLKPGDHFPDTVRRCFPRDAAGGERPKE